MTDEQRRTIERHRGVTATSLFLVQLIGIPQAPIRLAEAGFVNAYIKDEIHNVEYDRGLYLLFKPKYSLSLNDFLDEERDRKARIIEEYDYAGGYTMVVYQYDAKWEEDVKLITQGKFSKTSRGFQNTIEKTRTTQKMGRKVETMSIQHQIFKCVPEIIEYWEDLYGLNIDYKTDQCWEFYAEREIFNQETFKKLL